MVKTQLITIAEFKSPQTGPKRGPKPGPPSYSGFAQAYHKLSSGSAQAKLRFTHLPLRLKQQLLRSEDGNRNCLCRDSDVEFPVTKSTPYYMYPSYKVDHFVTRKDSLSEIQRHYQHSEQVVTAKVVVLIGTGGCGKSQLALDYCRQSQTDGRFTAIFWVDASSPNTVAQSYTTIAVAISKANVDTTDAAANIRLVKDIISTWTTAWPLVFDNFDEPKAFSEKPMQDYFPQGKKGIIIFTSRHVESDRLGHSINISDMLEGEALELLSLVKTRET